MVKFPTTQEGYFETVARETAKMSYPGNMSRSKKQVLTRGAKDNIEKFFARFPGNFWDSLDAITSQLDFDDWHKEQAQNLGQYLRDNNCLGNRENNSDVVAAKLINTFMHQLMKYERFRPLWNYLHLPLDQTTCDRLRKLNCSSLAMVKDKMNKSPYSLSYEEYYEIQHALRNLVDELNRRPEVEYGLLTSRIELNLLWAS